MYGDPARARGLSRSMGRINFENAPACESRGLRDRPHPRYCRTERPQRLEIIRPTEVAVYAHFKLQVRPGQLRSFAWKRRNADSYFFFPLLDRRLRCRYRSACDIYLKKRRESKARRVYRAIRLGFSSSSLIELSRSFGCEMSAT